MPTPIIGVQSYELSLERELTFVEDSCTNSASIDYFDQSVL
jgi:hypothetical protein